MVDLGDLVSILSGYAFDAGLFNDRDGVPVIRIRDVVPGVSKTYYSGSYTANFVIRDGDLLIGMDGEFNIAKWKGGTAVLNQRVCKINTASEMLDRNYLFHFLPNALKAIERDTPFVTVKHLSVKRLRSISIPLPPLPEQKRIAAILDKADALRRKRREAIAKLDTLLQSVFLEMFGNPATNPKRWPVAELRNLVSLGDSVNYGVVQPGENVSEGIPLVRVADVVAGAINRDRLKRITPEIEACYSRSRLNGSEILLTCVGSIGVVALADESLRGCNIARAVARIPCGSEIDREFVAEYLRSKAVQNYFLQETRTVSQPTLNIKQISETRVYCPPAILQQEYASHARTVRKTRAAQQSSFTEAERLFKRLQHSLLCG
jgi:type I restriction enzyme S subunit